VPLVAVVGFLADEKDIPAESACQTQPTTKSPNFAEIAQKLRFLRGENYLGLLLS
jgi:hypothetical protein